METCTQCGQRAATDGRGGIWLCVDHLDHTNPMHNYGAEPLRAPDTLDGDRVVLNECGRVWKIGRDLVTGQSHWFRIYSDGRDRFTLAVHHGGGNERFPLGFHGDRVVEGILKLDSLGRFHACWALMDLYHVADREARRETSAKYETAIVEKRIRVRRRGDLRYVTVLTKGGF